MDFLLLQQKNNKYYNYLKIIKGVTAMSYLEISKDRILLLSTRKIMLCPLATRTIRRSMIMAGSQSKYT